MTMMINKL